MSRLSRLLRRKPKPPEMTLADAGLTLQALAWMKANATAAEREPLARIMARVPRPADGDAIKPLLARLPAELQKEFARVLLPRLAQYRKGK